MSKFRAYASDALITLAIHALLLSVFAARAFSVDPEYYSVSGLRCMHSVRNFDVFSAQDIIIMLFLATAAGFALSAMEKWSERRRGAVLREYMLLVLLPSNAVTLAAASVLAIRVVRVYTEFKSSLPHTPPESYAGNNYAYVILVPLVMTAVSAVITLTFLLADRCTRKKA